MSKGYPTADTTGEYPKLGRLLGGDVCAICKRTDVAEAGDFCEACARALGRGSS